jgi:hypothetical protein
VPISIHLPTELLTQVDQRARSLGLSRSGYIALALRRDADPGGWSPGFFDALRKVDAELVDDVETLEKSLGPRKSRKAAPKL